MVSEAINHGGHVVQTFVGPNRGWTITMTSPQGLTCMLMEGNDYEGPMPPQSEAEERGRTGG